MKFFKPDWDDNAEAVRAEYRAHISAILPKMPATVQTLALGVNIHDGPLRRAIFHPSEARLTVSMRCGNLQGGYCDLKLEYREVRMRSADLRVLRRIARDDRAEALYDEVDSIDGRWVHRYLFWPDGEFAVGFGNLALHLVPAPKREFARSSDAYREVRG